MISVVFSTRGRASAGETHRAYLGIRTKFTRDNRNLAPNSCRLAFTVKTWAQLSFGFRRERVSAVHLESGFSLSRVETERTKRKLIKIPRGSCPRLIKTSGASRRSIGRLILLRLSPGDIRVRARKVSLAKGRRRADHL